jgi:hypothetical protein
VAERIAGEFLEAWKIAPIFMVVASRLMRQILVDYARGQGVPWSLSPEIPPRDVAQLFVDQRNQRFKGLWITHFPAYQQFANWVESD